ncbi:sugar ABC transporter ATP-binding protein [Treponema brennaborense]|uniref:Monosaccharide-transporting ATPase n=1 Tax=Treponema brennaborense (strain DSM 12168 / CIP 105900 / DD5/3) TaxID=906968 RepID=F4LK19_TREBD|nr:sugar ABC transporter ATP-binding protein [Treponema brennaborense]AEE17481.1 Monosaccharide-transporting ATPase [Treponema brennaborense DSM 12168]
MNEVIVRMEGICKSFPGVKALDGVSLSLKPGRVMALLGENGAGKSTLMKILSGIYGRDGGTVTLFGEQVDVLNPNTAKEKGIAIIHQELNLCRHLTVAENIFLGREKFKKGFIVDTAAMNKAAETILAKLGCDIQADTLVDELPVSKQQMVEIAKALSINAKVLIMDEPTSALTSKEINELFAIIKQLKSEGCAIVYISHRLEELKHIVDDVTIMRDGKFITSGEFADFDMESIISHMVGREIKEKYPRIRCPVGETVLDVRNLCAGPLVRDVSFQVRAGEIVGIAGLMGAGRTELTRALFGIDRIDSGDIRLDGKPITVRKPLDAIRHGIVLAPEDRKKDGLCTKLPVRENIALPNLDLLCNKIGMVNRKKEAAMVRTGVENLRIKLPSAEVNAATLSGGNQQKVVVAKWMGRSFRVVMFDEPTRGIDVAAKVEIYNLMNELKLQGVGVLFVSSEMPEVMGFADRILVMCDGRITGELPGAEATQEKILTLATSFENKLAV